MDRSRPLVLHLSYQFRDVRTSATRFQPYPNLFFLAQPFFVPPKADTNSSIFRIEEP